MVWMCQSWAARYLGHGPVLDVRGRRAGPVGRRGRVPGAAAGPLRAGCGVAAGSLARRADAAVRGGRDILTLFPREPRERPKMNARGASVREMCSLCLDFGAKIGRVGMALRRASLQHAWAALAPMFWEFRKFGV